ncbi:type II/IV secretion system ATPase subunit [Candidatus Aenigmatarchaeota archaeon]
MKRTIEKYKLVVNDVPADITIYTDTDKEYVPIYELMFPMIEPATEAVLDSVREKMVEELEIRPAEILNPEEADKIKKKFSERTAELIKKKLPNLPDDKQKALLGILLHQSLGLGPIEIMLQDRSLEEIVINSAKGPIWVYHIKLGWLKTNLTISSEDQIYNYAASIGRRVGEQITNLNPLMDAYLTSGDRTNATLFPISSQGNTLTVRKFARRPWTMTDFIEMGTLTPEVAAFLWLSIQYELNIVIAGGTASGKTSFLNALTCFIPPNHRILSIEDTREIQLPYFLHWVPLTTRPPNPEGRGEVTMLQIMINSLRMRPDRMIVGEMRRKEEAQVLFEAINTGHSVYSTLHANTAEEAFRRLVNPPIDVPAALLGGLQIIAVMHRDRRRNIRRVLQIAELIPSSGLKETRIDLNTVYQWIASEDKITPVSKSYRVINEIKLYTGMSERDIDNDIKEKTKILAWMVKNQVKDINEFGRIISEYYRNPDMVLTMVSKGESPHKIVESLEKKMKGKIMPDVSSKPVLIKSMETRTMSAPGKGKTSRPATRPASKPAKHARSGKR